MWTPTQKTVVLEKIAEADAALVEATAIVNTGASPFNAAAKVQTAINRLLDTLIGCGQASD